MKEQDKLWIEKCKNDCNYTMKIDNDKLFVVNADTDDVVFTFSEEVKTCKGCLYYEKCSKMRDDFARSAAPYITCYFFKDKDDFIEVVRCKDCKHGKRFVIGNDTFMYICHKIGLSGFEEDFYCSFGERRTDDA